jgi:transposase-like protein
MLIHLHKQATTTPKVRAAIQASDEAASALAERFGTTEQTVYKWKHRDSVHDRSHTPHRLQMTLTPPQEAVAVSLRTTLLVSLADLLAVVREFLNPNASRSGLDRCLRRHGVGNLRDLKAKAPKPKHSAFKACEPGYLHIDAKYLPQMADEASRRYFFAAIDRATRWGEGRLGIDPVDQFSPERAEPRLHPCLQVQDGGQCPALPSRPRTRLSAAYPHNSYG